MNSEKQHWDTSNEKAKELNISNFGSPDEVRKQAKPLRAANDRRQAEAILKEIMKKGPLASKSGIIARLTSKTIGKMVSSNALNKSCDKGVHYLALANLDRLFSQAIEPWQFMVNPEKNNQGLKARHYLYAPFERNKNMTIVKFTVKEYSRPDLTNTLYSIEALELILE
jgi:SOS response regulatory protein OraA/RecX